MSKAQDSASKRKQRAPGAKGSAAPAAPARKTEKTEQRSKSAATKAATAGASERTSATSQAGARISRRAADRLRSGHVWVYASDIEDIELADGEAPALLPVADARGILLGTALYSPTSQISLRMVSREGINEQQWIESFESRLRKAIARRRAMMDEGTNACRLCFSEADELPGLIVDKYGELVIVQRLTRGLVTPAVAEVCARVLREETKPAAILERPDPRIRELEGLPAPLSSQLWAATADAPTTATQFNLNGLKFSYDANSGQKTGAFLDQRENYVAARTWATRLGATERALDVCTYQGGFAMHLAQVCGKVTGIDASLSSLEVAERNAEENRKQLKSEIDWVEGDAFAVLRDWAASRERFDAIVLDPPAFAKSKRAVEGALRGYKELNLRALQMVRAGGMLVTCSCSHHVGWSELEGAVGAAAADAHRRVRLLERRGAAEDHPVVLNLPETEYLKCLVLEVE